MAETNSYNSLFIVNDNSCLKLPVLF